MISLFSKLSLSKSLPLGSPEIKTNSYYHQINHKKKKFTVPTKAVAEPTFKKNFFR